MCAPKKIPPSDFLHTLSSIPNFNYQEQNLFHFMKILPHIFYFKFRNKIKLKKYLHSIYNAPIYENFAGINIYFAIK